MSYTVSMGKKVEEESDVQKITAYLSEKKSLLTPMLNRPLSELRQSLKYKVMVKDELLKKVVSRILSDATFRGELHANILEFFGSVFARNLGRIILPPGSPWP